MPSFFSQPKPHPTQSQNKKHFLYSLRINGKHFAYERKQHEIVITSRYQDNCDTDEKQLKCLSQLTNIIDKLKQIIETACGIKPLHSRAIADFTHIEETLTIQQSAIDRLSNRLLTQITKPGEFDKVGILELGELPIHPVI